MSKWSWGYKFTTSHIYRGCLPEWSVLGWLLRGQWLCLALVEVRLCRWSVADWWSSFQRPEAAAAVGYGSHWVLSFVSLDTLKNTSPVLIIYNSENRPCVSSFSALWANYYCFMGTVLRVYVVKN